MKRINRKQAISGVIAEQPPLNATVLWKFPRDAFDDWIGLGMGEADSFEEYLERLHDAEAAAQQYGVTVVYCTMTPIEVASWMQDEGLDRRNAEHRAQAIGILATSDFGNESE